MSSVRVIAGNRAAEPGQARETSRNDEPVGDTSFPDALGTATGSGEGQSPIADLPRTAPVTGLGGATEPNSDLAGGLKLDVKEGAGRRLATIAPGNEMTQNPIPSSYPADRQREPAPRTQLEDRESQQNSTAGGIERNPVADHVTPGHGRRSSSNGGSASDATIGITSADFEGYLPVWQFTESGTNLSVERTDTGSPFVAPLGEDRLPGRVTSASSRDLSVQSAPDILTTEDQASARGSFAARDGHPTDVLSPADPVDSEWLDISAPRLAGSGTTGIGPDATKPIRLLASAESPVSAGNVTPGHFRSAIGTLENSHSLISLELPADAPNSAAGGTTTGELPVARSANSEMSSLSSTALSDQLPNQLLRSVDGGGGDIVLKLNPPELGDLMVRVLVNGRDVSAWFATPQIQVQQAISQAIGQLNTELGHAGYNLNGAWVGADGWSARQKERNLATPQQRGNRSKIDEPTDVATQPAAFGVSVYV
jgi:hypothetical protein